MRLFSVALTAALIGAGIGGGLPLRGYNAALGNTLAKPKIAPPDALGTVAMDLLTGRPRMTASVNGRPAETVEFDTGSTGAVVQRAYVEKHRLPITGKVPLRSPYGNAPPVMADTVLIETIELGGITVRNVRAVVLDDQGFVGADAPLIIGPSEFPKHVITLDYPGGTFSLTETNPGGAAGWQRRKPGHQLETIVTVQGQRVPLLVDSGNPGVLTLPKSMAGRIDPQLKLTQVGAFRTVDREIAIYLGDLNRDAVLATIPLKLGKTLFADVPFANLGSQGLLSFRLTIDNPRRRWRLEKTDAGPVILDSTPRRRPNPTPLAS